jgi:Tol biopolymer transport system component
MRAIRAPAAALTAAGVLAGTVGGATQVAERIAFTNNRATWVIDSDGSGLRQLTHAPYSDGDIAWSPNSALLAFTRYRPDKGCNVDQTRGDLYLIGVGGTGLRRLTSSGCMFSPPSHSAFAPKGQKLAFDDDSGIHVAQAPGWKPRSALAHGLFPSWAPDARRLVEASSPNSVEVLDTVTHATRARTGRLPAVGARQEAHRVRVLGQPDLDDRPDRRAQGARDDREGTHRQPVLISR